MGRSDVTGGSLTDWAGVEPESDGGAEGKLALARMALMPAPAARCCAEGKGR